MRLLIIGGTRFLGRHLARQALERGHELTLLHRGRSNPDLFPEARHILADRDGDLAALRESDLRWDAAIDTCAYFPRQVHSLASALEGRVAHYQLVSTISVYAGFTAPGQDEDAPVATLADLEVQVVTGETYGGLKALCEAAARERFGPACLVARPGLLVGPHDPTDRFTWWVQRMQRARADDRDADVLAPGDPAAPVQCIDCRDAAAWMLLQAECGTIGTFNVDGPAQPITMGDFLSVARDTLAPQAQLTWVDEAFLLAREVAPWSDLPLWLPQASSAMHQVSVARALATGLQCRPMVRTIADTAAWEDGRPPMAEGATRPAVGLSAERERQLLSAWRGREQAAPASRGR
jgi:2'-hydroxyisoflavone reductase